MSKRSWTRREFGKVVAPVLVGVSAVTARSNWAASTGASGAPVELWPEGRATSDFFRRHLPAGHTLGSPTLAASHQAGVSTRSATFAVLRGESEVGRLDLDASFGSGRSTPLWQSTRVAGSWYGASIANAFSAGCLA